QQRRVPDTDVVGGDSRRQENDEIEEKHDECKAAPHAKIVDDDSGWHVSPSGEKTQQSTSSRRRSSIASPERQRQHAYRRTPESDGGNRSIGPTSAAAEGFKDYGTDLTATFETESG
ncbi:unnamed protein product, partial [Ectocarpus sp. 4 AP-2014]